MAQAFNENLSTPWIAAGLAAVTTFGFHEWQHMEPWFRDTFPAIGSMGGLSVAIALFAALGVFLNAYLVYEPADDVDVNTEESGTAAAIAGLSGGLLHEYLHSNPDIVPEISEEIMSVSVGLAFAAFVGSGLFLELYTQDNAYRD